MQKSSLARVVVIWAGFFLGLSLVGADSTKITAAIDEVSQSCRGVSQQI
jgi:hypothetical protein